MKRIFYILAVLIVLGVGWYFWTKQPPLPENESAISSQNPVSTSTPTTSVASSTIAKSLPKVTINMTDNGFEPNSIFIKRGQVVVFVNVGQKNHWPASDLHPTHEIYPEFDPKKPITPNESWSFAFAKVGKWNMHDHLHASFRGTIEVEYPED